MKKFFDNIWTIKCFDSKGNIKWIEEGKNNITDEAEEAMLEVFFRGSTTYAPVQFYIRLCNDTLTETDTLTTVLNEPASTYGYAAQLIERSTTGFPTKELSDGDYRLISKPVTFTAVGGAIGPVTTAYLATTSDNTGKLICYKGLSVTRTIASGDSAVMYMRIKTKPGS